MEFISHTRSVQIDQDPRVVADFLRSVPNLPRWTRFFVRAGDFDGKAFAMETKLGPAKTWIEEEQRTRRRCIHIVSLFGERRETAAIEVEDGGRTAKVEFHIRLPEGWTADRVAQQLQQLDEELQTLKQILEATPA